MTKKEKRLLHEIISKQCKERGLEVDPDSINEKTDFIEDLGLDSLDLVEIVISLEATLGQTFDFDINDFMVVKDMGDVYNFIDNFKEKLKQKLEEEARLANMSDNERVQYEIEKLKNMVDMLPEGEAKEEKIKELDLGIRLVKEKNLNPSDVFGMSIQEMESKLKD
tara:strand:+ start:2466 stop:2963 length:498 start_codon:yes stop_codon:yes gene_type:complete